MKKILAILVLLLGINFAMAENFPYDINTTDTDDPQQIMKNTIQDNNNAIDQIGQTYVGEETLQEQSPASYYISTFINYFLGILGFFAVLTLLYGFSLVFVEKTDEGIKKGWKYVKIAITAIIIIGVSWLISIWIIGIYTHNVAS